MSITLTTASQVNTLLGGSSTVAYDHVVISPLTFNPVNNTINGTVRLTSSTEPDMDVITGSLVIDNGTGSLLIDISQLDIRRKMQLSPAQILSVQGIMNNSQDSIESGLIGVGVIDGTQSTGT